MPIEKHSEPLHIFKVEPVELSVDCMWIVKEKSVTPRCFPQAILRGELPLIKMKPTRGTVFREKIRNRLLDWLGLRVTKNSKWRCQVQNSQQICELVKFKILLAI